MRPEGWETLLYEHIRSARTRPFAWGENDCVLWCAEWLAKIKGIDFAEGYRGTYDSEQGAQEVLQAMGFASPSELADSVLPRVPVARAQRGDIMQHPAGMLGICDGAFAHFLTMERETRIGFLLCVSAWKVE